MDCGVGEWSFDSLVKGWSRDESLHDLRDSVGRCWWLSEASLGLVGGQASLESARLWRGLPFGWAFGGVWEVLVLGCAVFACEGIFGLWELIRTSHVCGWNTCILCRCAGGLAPLGVYVGFWWLLECGLVVIEGGGPFRGLRSLAPLLRCFVVMESFRCEH